MSLVLKVVLVWRYSWVYLCCGWWSIRPIERSVTQQTTSELFVWGKQKFAGARARANFCYSLKLAIQSLLSLTKELTCFFASSQTERRRRRRAEVSDRLVRQQRRQRRRRRRLVRSEAHSRQLIRAQVSCAPKRIKRRLRRGRRRGSLRSYMRRKQDDEEAKTIKSLCRLVGWLQSQSQRQQVATLVCARSHLVRLPEHSTATTLLSQVNE